MDNSLIIDKQKYTKLFRALKMEEKTDNAEDTRYVGIILESLSDILYKFGLPDIKEFRAIIEDNLYKSGPRIKSLMRLEQKLKEAATSFLCSPALTNRDLLPLGKENKTSSFEILPLMNINTRNYNIFIYEYLWIKKSFPIDSILQEFEFYNQIIEPDQLFLFRSVMNAKAENILRQAGLNYVDEYIQYLEYDKFRLEGDFGQDFEFPEYIQITESFWKKIEFFDSMSARIYSQVLINDTWQKITLFLDFEDLISLLDECVQGEVSLIILELTDLWMKGERGKSTFKLKDLNNQYLQCNKTFQAIQMMEEEDEGTISPSAYILIGSY